tara:strand:+ start:172 stop:978 length:807 start_codon:yes stop_codon:yes gene_type:complete
MKKYILILTLLFISLSCEDVIEVDVPTDTTRLSIDALIRIDTGLSSTRIEVKATETTSFFEEIGPAVLDDIQLMSTTTNISAELEEQPLGSGIYVINWPTEALTQGEYLLNITYNNEQYEATTSFVPTVPFDDLRQGDGSLFSEDETEIVVSYTDEATRDDFYLFDFDFDKYLVSEDTFYQGQSFEFSYFYEDGLEPGRELEISILGTDEAFYNYMNQLIVQSGGDQGPFSTPAATVRGNIVNLTDADNIALGYFALCQEYKETVTIE